MSPEVRKDFIRMLLATLFFGMVAGIFTSTLNNYLSDVHGLGAEERGWMEFPRELPGFFLFLVMGIFLTRLREARIAAVAMFFTAVGALGFSFLSSGMALLVLFMFVWSMGDHIIFGVEGPIGLKLAKKGAEGRRLGQIGGARNLGVILGVGVIYFLAKSIGDRYDLFYLGGAICAVIAGGLYMTIQTGKGDPKSRRLVWRSEYKLFYAISALFGIRKQIFIVFGSWVLVSLHGVSVSTMALLYFIAASLGVLLRPLLGDIIDWLGERTVLAADEVLLLFVCLTYAFSSALFPKPWDLYLLYGAYILDVTLFALRIARTTYLKKIALDPKDITPTITLGITIDHAVAMTLPVLSGYIWESFGFEWVFVLASLIAVVGFFVCLQIKVPIQKTIKT